MHGRSRLRNRTLANVFNQMGLIEAWGTGIQRIQELAKEYNVLAIFVDNDRHIWYNNTGLSDIFEFTGKDSGYTLSEYNK